MLTLKDIDVNMIMGHGYITPHYPGWRSVYAEKQQNAHHKFAILSWYATEWQFFYFTWRTTILCL